MHQPIILIIYLFMPGLAFHNYLSFSTQTIQFIIDERFLLYVSTFSFIDRFDGYIEQNKKQNSRCFCTDHVFPTRGEFICYNGCNNFGSVFKGKNTRHGFRGKFPLQANHIVPLVSFI